MNRAARQPQLNRALPRSAAARLKLRELSATEWLLVVVAALAAATIIGLLVTDGFRRASELTDAQRWEAHTLDVIATAEQTRSDIRNMQRGERGYLLTGDDQDLAPYAASRRLALSGLQQLHKLTADNADQVATFERLSGDFREVDSRLATTIAAKRAGQSTDALALVESGRGEIGHIDADIDGMIGVESRLLEQRRNTLRAADHAASQNRLAFSMVGLIALGAVVWLLFATLSGRRRIEFETVRADLAEQLVSRETQLAEQIEELNALYASAPIGLAFFSRDYRYLRVNEELARIHGIPVADHLGRPLREIVPIQANTAEPVIDRVFATGDAVRDVEIMGQTPLHPGVGRHWLTGFYPVKNEQGGVDAVGAWVVEISERKRAEEREALLAREVDHRAKNLLAVVQSVVQLTQASEPEELKAGIVGRIQALARAHSLLADSRWDGAQLGDLVREELAPYLAGSEARATVEGPPLLLRPAAAQSLGMVLHELATNAVKYGALSTASGRLEVSWKRNDGALEMDWKERGGPPVSAPETSGFGSKIIRASVERQLHGSLVKNWRPEGLQCTIRISAREALGASEQQSPAQR